MQWYLMLTAVEGNNIYRVGEGTKEEMVQRLRSLAQDLRIAGMVIEEDLSSSVTGYPQIRMRPHQDSLVDPENEIILQVCDDGREL